MAAKSGYFDLPEGVKRQRIQNLVESARPQVPHRTAKRGVDRRRGRLISKGMTSARSVKLKS